MEENQAQVTESVGGEAPPVAHPELSVTDLQNLRTVLDVASRRGAFGANEMSSVGAVFDRLDKFLAAVAPAPAPAPETTQEQVA
jgi:hypothetical protein